MGNPLFVSGDPGANSAVTVVESMLGGAFCNTSAADSRTADYWPQKFSIDKPSVIFIGTSDSPDAFEVEAAARIAAARMNIPTVVIEDFPGNYKGVSGVRDRLLVADGQFSLELAKSRSAVSFESAIAIPGVRYDPLRGCKRITPVAPSRTVLWAGQPETEDSIATLENLAPAIVSLDLHLLFRAHPRDSGYESGDYSDILGKLGSKAVDITNTSWNECLRMSPAMTITQFSSVAVELGFSGIPTVFALYRDIGQRRLLKKKGYAIPPMCDEGAAWVIQEPGYEVAALENALNSELRSKAMNSFSVHMQASTPQLPILRDYLYNHRLI